MDADILQFISTLPFNMQKIWALFLYREMKVTRRGTLAYDGERIIARGWAFRGIKNPIPSEAEAEEIAAILIHIAARHGIELREVEQNDYPMPEPIPSERMMLEAIARIRRQPA